MKKEFFAIPDLCRNTSLLLVLLVGQLVVSTVWLLLPVAQDLESYGLYSLYIQSILLLCSAGLCFARQYIAKFRLVNGALLATFLVVSITVGVEYTSQSLSSGWNINYIDFARLGRVALAATITFLVLTRYFVLLAVLDSRSKAEAESKIIALQSKIQPHFLFNSLNTISELTVINPPDAEKAINSLSVLFRSSLENKRKHHSIESEVNLCERYLELERWRLGERLSVSWNILIEDQTIWQTPKLIMQPLIENAIVHGVQQDGRIDVAIDLRESKHHISFKVENSLGTQNSDHKGHGIALDNIRERLQVLYDDQQNFKIKQSGNTYSVIMRFPKQKRNLVNETDYV